jgi:hypothetical protein
MMVTDIIVIQGGLGALHAVCGKQSKANFASGPLRERPAAAFENLIKRMTLVMGRT